MRVGIHSPYLDTLGGGERYMLTLASHWSKTHDVTVFWDYPILEEAGRRFGLDISRIHREGNVFAHSPLPLRLGVTKRFDCMVFLTDGSVPMSLSKINILHVQVPFGKIAMPFFKKMMYKAVVYNSRFTMEHAGLAHPRSIVIHPPADTHSFQPGKKEHVILGVARFTSQKNVKRQDVLIRSFAEAHDSGKLTGTRLILAGGTLPEDREYLDALKRQAHGYPITLIPDVKLLQLRDLYAKAMVFWHAAGYGQDDPRYMEHFGITTVEAMAAGCVPVVYNGGGQREIIKDSHNGFVWDTTGELVDKTVRILSDPQLRTSVSDRARDDSGQYDVSVFCRTFDSLLASLSGTK